MARQFKCDICGKVDLEMYAYSGNLYGIKYQTCSKCKDRVSQLFSEDKEKAYNSIVTLMNYIRYSNVNAYRDGLLDALQTHISKAITTNYEYYSQIERVKSIFSGGGEESSLSIKMIPRHDDNRFLIICIKRIDGKMDLNKIRSEMEKQYKEGWHVQQVISDPVQDLLIFEVK